MGVLVSTLSIRTQGCALTATPNAVTPSETLRASRLHLLYIVFMLSVYSVYSDMGIWVVSVLRGKRVFLYSPLKTDRLRL